MDACKLHGFPLTQLCRDCHEKYICEVCAVDGDHKYHEVTQLRPLVIDIMKKFEDNFTNFQTEFAKAKKSRAKEFRQSIFQELDDFFGKLHCAVESMRKQKVADVEELFRKMKINDLADFEKYQELRSNVQRALVDMQGHYRDLALSKIYTNKDSIRKIDKAIVDISSHLHQAYDLYEAHWKSLVKIQTDDAVINHVVKSFVDSNCKTEGALAVPQRILDIETAKLCDGIKFDIDVIEVINRKKAFMLLDEQRVVVNAVKGTYQGVRQLVLNSSEVTDNGLEILAGAVRHNAAILKIDVSSNKFTDIGLYTLCEAFKSPENRLQVLKLSSNRLKDKACTYIFDTFRSHRFLTQLHLSNNHIGNEGAGSLARLITQNKSINHLYLDNNQIEDSGAN